MFVIDAGLRNPQLAPVIKHDDLVAELDRQLAQKKFKGKELAAHLGIAPARITEIRKRERRIQPQEMHQVAEWLGVSDEIEIIPDEAMTLRQVPIVGSVPAGNWQEAATRSRNFVPIPTSDAPKNGYALTVEGDSMDLHVPNGFTIAVDPEDRDLFPGRLYVVMNEDGETTFKEYREGPARLVPASSNPAHKEIPVSGGGFRILGRVVWSGKRHV